MRQACSCEMLTHLHSSCGWRRSYRSLTCETPMSGWSQWISPVFRWLSRKPKHATHLTLWMSTIFWMIPLKKIQNKRFKTWQSNVLSLFNDTPSLLSFSDHVLERHLCDMLTFMCKEKHARYILKYLLGKIICSFFLFLISTQWRQWHWLPCTFKSTWTSRMSGRAWGQWMK